MAWKSIAMLLVVLSGLLTIGVVKFRNPLFAKRTVILVLLLAGLGFFFLYLEPITHSWVTQSRSWWKLLLGDVFLAGVYFIAGWTSSRKEAFFSAAICVPLILVEPAYSKLTGLTYIFASLMVIVMVSAEVGQWLSRKVVQLFSNDQAPLIISVFFLCVATAIQLFVLS